MRFILSAFMIATIAGCLAPSPDTASGPIGSPEPPDPGPLTLLATMTFMSHSGAGSVSMVPSGNISQPIRCTLFREGVAFGNDTCEVIEGSPHGVEAAWHISASFEGSSYPIDDSRRWSEKTVKAYDEQAELAGFWDGAKDYHEDHARYIE